MLKSSERSMLAIPILVALTLVLVGFGTAEAQVLTTVPVNPNATYLRTQGDPDALASVPIDLGSLGVSGGDLLALTREGDFTFGTIPTDTSTAMLGVFSASNVLLSAGANRVQDALEAGSDIVTAPTGVDSLPTDILEDFFIPGTGTQVQVPTGATHLFVAAHDSFYGDNSDPEADFQVVIAVDEGEPDCVPAPSGLVSWWPGDGDTGDIEDGNNGNLVNGAGFSAGHIETAFDFDGVNDYILIGNPSNLDISGNLTVEFWFRVNTSKYNVLVAKGIGLSGNEWWVRHRGDTSGILQAAFQDAELDLVQVDATATLTVGSFHHLAWIRDGSTGRLYLDGVEIGNATNAALGDIRNPHDLIFGADNRFGTGDFSAVTMDEVAIYDRALTPAEIQAIFNAGSAGKCKPDPECAAAPTGLVSWWPLDETGGASAADIADTNAGSLVNGPVFATGTVGNALSFDGVNDYILIGNPSNLDISGNLTVEFWFRVNTSKYNVLVAKGIGLSGNEWWVRHRGDTSGILQAAFQDAELDLVQVDATATLTVGSFHHLAWMRDGSTGRLYLDGVEIGNATNAALGDIRNPHDLIFGADNRFGTDEFSAVTMDEVAIYDRALTPAEIQAIFNAGSAGKCKPECVPAPSGLVSWWPGDGDANDIEGNNNGALQGSAAFATGQVADAFSLDGVDDYVSVPENDDDLDAGLGELTVTAWIDPSGGGAASQRIVNKGLTLAETANRPGYRLGLVGGQLRFGVSDNNSDALIDAQPSGLFPSDGEFHHVAGVLDRSTLEVRLYLDGGLIATQSFASLGSLNTAVPLAIGALDRGGFGPNIAFFHGLIDEVAVFDRALTAAEITAIFDAGSAGKCKNASPDVACSNPVVSNDPGACGAAVVCDGGVGSCSDPDGDATTISCNPAGPYAVGITDVTVSCNDGQALSPAGCAVTVQDTAPPTITCPAPLILECNSVGGVDASDPRITAFLGGVVASDNCGVGSITNDTPSFFSFGTQTTVTFTAVDAAANVITCPSTVTFEAASTSVSGLQFTEELTSLLLTPGTITPLDLQLVNTSSVPIEVAGIEFLSDFAAPAVSVVTSTPLVICAGDTVNVGLEINTTNALEGLHSGVLKLTSAGDPSEVSTRIDIRISGELQPDLTTITGSGGIIITSSAGPPPLAAGDPFTMSIGVLNIGAAPASTFTVNFFDGTTLLGSTEVIGGLAIDGSTNVEFNVAGGALVEGFHVMRVEVVPPAEGEISTDNNATATILQIGTLPVTGAVIVVSSSVSQNCVGDVLYVSGRADYFLVSDTGSLVDFPVQGGRVTVTILDQAGASIIDSFPITHTLTTGSFVQSTNAPAPGNYIVRVEVTDFSLVGEQDLPLTVVAGGNCAVGGTPPAPGEILSVDLSVCSNDIVFLQQDCLTPLSITPNPGDTICIGATIQNFGTSPIANQPVSFTAHVQEGDSFTTERIDTRLVNFLGVGSVSLTVPWTLPADGEHVIQVEVEPTVSQRRNNDSATRGIKVGTSIPMTDITIGAVVGGCGADVVVNGRAVYTGSFGETSTGIPVGCGIVTVTLFDAAQPGVPLSSSSGAHSDKSGFFRSGTGGPLVPGSYIIEIQVSDGTLVGIVEKPLTCLAPEAPDPVVGPPPPPPGSPPGSPPGVDLFLFAEDIAFLGDGLCQTGLFQNPLPGEEAGVFASIHYVGSVALSNQPVTVTEFIPVGETLQAVPIASTTVDFPGGGGIATSCFPWTPQTAGTRIVQVAVDPTVVQFELNDAATRAITVGQALCNLELDSSNLGLLPGEPAQFTIAGSDSSNITPSLELSIVAVPPNPLPAGLTFAFGPASPLTLPFTTTLTVTTDGTTPAGRHSFFLLGRSDVCTALGTFSVSLPLCQDADGDGFGSPGQPTCLAGNLPDCDDANSSVHPTAGEICDGVDNNCDGNLDEVFALGTACDGIGACGAGVLECATLASTRCSTDPGGSLDESTAEVCDGLDNDCDGSLPLDESDADLDGVLICDGDCDDTNIVIFPGNAEVCDGFDNDCNLLTDDGLGSTTCGLGVCEHTVNNCVGGVGQICDPFEGASAEICSGLDNDCNGLVDDAATLLVESNKHTVGTGSHPGSTKDPLVGIEVCAYDKSVGSCAQTVCGGISHQHYECIALGDGISGPCDSVGCCTADQSGQCEINLPTGDYVVISGDATKTVLPDPLGVSASDVICGEFKQKHLQQIVKANGQKTPGKTTRLTGSELLIIEPEFVEWTGTEELYPFILESVGDWDVTVSVVPPEGFVADFDTLSEVVDWDTKAVQFTITDVGSDWVPTEVNYVVEHYGRREVILSRAGVRLSETLAAAKGLDRYGHVLGPHGNPLPEPGFDPRAPRPVEIAGWIERSEADAMWTVKLHVEEASELTLAITRGQGIAVEELASGSFAPGDYEFTWDGMNLGPGQHFLSLNSGQMTQKVRLIE